MKKIIILFIFLLSYLNAYYASVCDKVEGYEFQNEDDKKSVVLCVDDTDSVMVIDLSKGAKLKFLYEQVGSGNKFKDQKIDIFWKNFSNNNENAFAVVNGAFFNPNEGDYFNSKSAGLAFPLKNNNTLITSGYDKKETKLKYLGLTNKLAKVTNDNLLNNNSYLNVLVALSLDADGKHSGLPSVGRNLLGVSKDGTKIYILVSDGMQVSTAETILQKFGADSSQIMMLDGSGSSQLRSKDYNIFGDNEGEVDSQGYKGRPIPQAIGILTSVNYNKKESVIDGAGSIIDANKSDYGLNKDIASMHAHDPYNSTVVFQWKNGYSSCSQLDIGTLKENTNGKYIKGDNLGKAIVTVRSWNSAFPNTQKDEIFEVNLDKEPFSIEKASGSSGWTLISITTKNPISNEPKNGHYIYATCSKDNFKYKNRKTLYYDDANKGDNKLVSLTNNYFWAGNGSLISYLKTSYDYRGFGSDKDSAIAYSSHKSINLFQWYVSDKCKKLKIGVQKGWKISDEKISTNGINIKSWASKKWNSNNYCNGKLPCTINVSNKGYYILKVKTNAGVIPTHDSEKRHIMATCVE